MGLIAIRSLIAHLGGSMGLSIAVKPVDPNHIQPRVKPTNTVNSFINTPYLSLGKGTIFLLLTLKLL